MGTSFSLYYLFIFMIFNRFPKKYEYNSIHYIFQLMVWFVKFCPLLFLEQFFRSRSFTVMSYRPFIFQSRENDSFTSNILV